MFLIMVKVLNFLIEIKKDDKISKDNFDYVVVSTGHFSVPFIPEYPGMKSFPGRIMHSHDFRDAEEFRDKNVVVLVVAILLKMLLFSVINMEQKVSP